MSDEIELSNGATISKGRNKGSPGAEHFIMLSGEGWDSAYIDIPKQDQERAATFFQGLASELGPPPQVCNGCELCRGNEPRREADET